MPSTPSAASPLCSLLPSTDCSKASWPWVEPSWPSGPVTSTAPCAISKTVDPSFVPALRRVDLRHGPPPPPPGRQRRLRGSGTFDGQGYVQVLVDGRRYRLHRLVMEGVLGRPLETSEVVHHIDGVRTNNCPENLRLYGRSEHTYQHGPRRPLVSYCEHCGEPFVARHYTYRFRSRFCSRACYRTAARLLTAPPPPKLAGAGVRPSPGAATFASSGVTGFSNMPGKSELAAPGDGQCH